MVDIMLVLLIIFIITVHVIQHSVNIDLPRASNAAQDTKPENGSPPAWTPKAAISFGEVKITKDELGTQLKTAAAQNPRPELHIRGGKSVRYENVAQAMAAAQQAGLRKIGFITEQKVKESKPTGGKACAGSKHLA